MNYVGIDHHRQYSHITWLDERSEVVKSGRVANLRRELEGFLQGIGDVKAVIEAGRSSYTMVDVLADLGVETTVAHPKDVKAIAKAKVKTDQRDSYKLAHLLRTGYIPEVHRRSRENRSSQRVLRQRAFYVGKQTAVKNRLRALLAQQGEEIRGEVSWVENLFTEKGMKVLQGLALPEREAKMVGVSPKFGKKNLCFTVFGLVHGADLRVKVHGFRGGRREKRAFGAWNRSAKYHIIIIMSIAYGKLLAFSADSK